MYRVLKRSCWAIILLIRSFVLPRPRQRSLLKVLLQTNSCFSLFRSFPLSLSLVNFCLLLKIFHFWFRTPAAKINSAKITQLVSLVSQSKDIDARALLDSKENIAKKVSFRFLHKCRSDIHASTTLLPVGWLTEPLIVKRVSFSSTFACTPSCFCKGGGVSYNHSKRFISTSL